MPVSVPHLPTKTTLCVSGIPTRPMHYSPPSTASETSRRRKRKRLIPHEWDINEWLLHLAYLSSGQSSSFMLRCPYLTDSNIYDLIITNKACSINSRIRVILKNILATILLVSEIFHTFAVQSLRYADILESVSLYSTMVNLDNSAKDVRMSKDALPKCRLYNMYITALGVSCFFIIYI